MRLRLDDFAVSCLFDFILTEYYLTQIVIFVTAGIGHN